MTLCAVEQEVKLKAELYMSREEISSLKTQAHNTRARRIKRLLQMRSTLQDVECALRIPLCIDSVL
eukprot:758328-Hanusia_phi.AAC.4